MSRPAHRTSLWTALAVAGVVTTTACGEELQVVDEEFVEEDGVQLGRIHVLLQPATVNESVSDSTSLLEVTARFAYFHGLDEEFVRARIDMPFLSTDLLAPRQCERTELLASSHGTEEGDHRELVLMDAGALRVLVGDTRFEVPITLVPDLLPYMSGVEYGFFGLPDAVPLVELEGPTRVSVSADGAGTEALPAFVVDGSVPAPLELQATAEPRYGRVVARWAASPQRDDTSAVILRVTPLRDGVAQSEGLTCVFPDEGQATIDLASLDLRGLAHTPDALRVVGSRLDRAEFEAGKLAGGELVVEFREQVVVGHDE